MSWDGLYTHERVYPQFEVGDEVYVLGTTAWKAGSTYKTLKGESYTVIKCYNPYPNRPDLNVWCITLLNDLGKEERYASYRFRKTDRQIREDKIKLILK
jgi:hypothetical protein